MTDFELILSADGSPTLAPTDGEAMHNLAGAISETHYCYTQPYAAMAQSLGRQPALLVVGLGLGSIEMLAAASEKPPLRIVSFESEPALRAGMTAWLKGEQDSGVIAKAIAAQASAAAKLSACQAETIRERLAAMLNDGRWQIRAELEIASLPPERFQVIAFDAYSKATSPHLWRDDLLAAMLAQCAANEALLSTYAATGALKRAMRNAGFTLLLRAGFGPKRESTLAIRGVDSEFFGALMV